MTTFATGHLAEAAAADYLRAHAYGVVDQNWRTKWCEIDIVAKHQGAIYMCEVKYRKSVAQGSGIAYITPAKLRQMAKAAHSWVALHNWSGEYQLAAIEVSGPDFAVTAFITDI